MDITAQLYLMTSRVEKIAVKNSDWSYGGLVQITGLSVDVLVLMLLQEP